MRRSQRLSSSGQRSHYFEDDVDELENSKDNSQAGGIKTKSTKPDDNFGEVDELQLEFHSDVKDEDETDSFNGETPHPRSKKRGRHPRSSPKRVQSTTPFNGGTSSARKRIQSAKATSSRSGNGDQHQHDNEDDDSDEDDSPRFEVIPLPPLRDTGGIAYAPQRLHPNTMEFLKDLKANNKRNWLKLHDPEYRRSLKDWESFVGSLTERIIEVDETIPELPLKDVIFRIYRDIRFSNDPTPYKPHYSAAWSRTGRKGPYACYYIHCEPGSCFIGGGLWHPDKDALARLRNSIDERPHRLRRVLMNAQFRSTFLPSARDSEKSVIAAFVESNKENALKKRPQGFHPDHRDIELLKLRNYTVGKKVDTEDLTSEDALDKIMSIVQPMVEYVTFLNSVVMPDPNLDELSDEED